ncbi:MAG TPA: hypothetical protein DEB63_22780 [Agrobacterium sp.]|nr:hypothetical protein [Agrobacterium sp.]
MLSTPKAASQRGGNVLHAGSSLLQINTRQIKAPCLGLRSGQLETHHLNLPFRDSCSNFVVAKIPIGDSGKPRLQAEADRLAIGDEPTLPVRNVNIGSARLFLAWPTSRLWFHNKERGNDPEIEETTQCRTGRPAAASEGCGQGPTSAVS